MSQTTENLNDVLQILKDLDKTSSFEVYLPSLQRTALFKQINTEQLKKLIKTVIDSPIHNSEFITTFNQIIKDNILDETIDTDQLDIFDKTLIIIKTRIESVSPEYAFNLKEEELEITKDFKIDLSHIYDTFVNNKPVYKSKTLKTKDCEVVATLPSIQTENKLEKELYKNTKIEISTPEELRNTVGETFINELTKYISSLKINEQEVDLNQLNFKTRIKIVEQLPVSCTNGVLKYIEEYKECLKPLITHTKAGLEKDIPLDATLFNM